MKDPSSQSALSFIHLYELVSPASPWSSNTEECIFATLRPIQIYKDNNN